MRILVVENYAADRQQSMLRFGALLERELSRRGLDVQSIRPAQRLMPRGQRSGATAGKWLGYADKYILFPRRLQRWILTHANAETVVHVVDHSNAVYVPRRATVPWVVTCHDLLAVLGARGDEPSCPASWLGRRLQGRVVRGLALSAGIAAVSRATLRDVERVVPPRAGREQQVISLGLNYPFGSGDARSARAALARLDHIPWHQPFVLHVGSNLPRKNKPAILRIFAKIADRWPGNLVFCGAPLTDELLRQATTLGVVHRVFAAAELTEPELAAVYQLAHALVYPSICEGFGWPIIEAQACGCPVVCSDRTSLPEVAGDGALVFPIENEAAMAEAIIALQDGETRGRAVQHGFGNVGRFSNDRMCEQYTALYSKVVAARKKAVH
jgi:glycosyltransferase involved in cell wall biosynthesis